MSSQNCIAGGVGQAGDQPVRSPLHLPANVMDAGDAQRQGIICPRRKQSLSRSTTMKEPPMMPLRLFRTYPLKGRSFYPIRYYATQSSLGRNSSTTRKQVTVVNDDGRVKWGQLSTGEKVARTTQQSFNFLVVLAGAAGTVCELPSTIFESMLSVIRLAS